MMFSPQKRHWNPGKSGYYTFSFSGKEVKKCFGQSEARVAILDFESFQKVTRLLQNTYNNYGKSGDFK